MKSTYVRDISKNYGVSHLIFCQLHTSRLVTSCTESVAKHWLHLVETARRLSAQTQSRFSNSMIDHLTSMSVTLLFLCCISPSKLARCLLSWMLVQSLTMCAVRFVCFTFLLFAHTVVAFVDVKTVPEQTVKVSPGQAVLITCPARRLDADDMVTWETANGEFLSLGDEYLVPSVTKSVQFVCRRRSLKSGAMVFAKVHVELAQRLRVDGEFLEYFFALLSDKTELMFFLSYIVSFNES